MSTGLFDDLLIDDAPASTGLFDDLLAPDERRRRRGGARNEFEPYAAGVETLPDHLAPIEASTAQAGRGGDAFARRDPRRVDRFVPDATFGSVAQDIGAGLLQIGPTAVKGAADLARLVTGDAIGKGLSDAMEGGMEAIRENVGSERAAAQRRNFEADMRDDSVSVWEALSENKGALADQILPTLGSMALPMGAAGAVGKLATMGRAAQALDKTALAARVASAQQAAGIGATAAQNAADTFAELVDRGVPMYDAYVAAGITMPFSVIAGRLTGGGAEMAAVRALSGGGVGRGLLALGQASGREGFQEVGEELGQITGEAVATGAMPSLASVGKQLAVAGTLGGIVGGGANVAGQAAETWRGAERAQDPLPRVEPALDPSIDQTVPPAPRRDPVETALDPSAPLDGKSLLDAFGITRVEPRAADPAPQPAPLATDPLTEDFASLARDITQVEVDRGIAQPQAAPAMAHPQEEAPGALPAEPAPQYEILGSGTMLVKRPISEVRPLAPGAWMISAPGGTIVSRSAAPTVQAALDAKAQAFATSAAPAAAAAPDDATALAEGQPALTPAQAARALQAAPSPQPQPAVPQAQTTAASEVADYTANRDGTLIVNLAQQEAAALLPDVKLIQTGRGLLVGRTSAQEVAALLDVMHVPQSFASQQEASDFGRKHWPDGDIEVSNTGSGWVIMPSPKQESAHDLAAVAASVEQLNAVIQRDQRGADRGGSVDVVPDADLVGVAGQQAAVLGRAIRAAFGVPVHFVRNLTANGAWYDGRVLLDVGHLSRNAQSPKRTAGMLVAVTGHETEHAFQTSKDPRDVAINARLANVVRKHLKAGALQEQLAHEQSKSRRQITRKYAFREIGANLGGGFWAQSSFWGDVYALDKGSTARRLFYRFMQAATKMATVLRGSRLDPSRYVSDVAAVKAAYVQATAERLGMRLPASPPAALPASLPATPPVAQPTSVAPGAAAQDRSAPGSEPDPRLQDPELRDEFEASRADIGWHQIGGRLLRDPRTAIDPNAADAVYNGDVVGRTQWLGPDLWRNRPHEGGRVTEQEAHNAVDRALRGAPLSARQRRFVSYVLDSIEARMTARERAALDALDEALIEAQDARIDAFWASLAEVEAQEERDAIQAQDGAYTEDAGRAGQAAGAVAGVSQEGDNRAQDAPRQGGVASEAGLTLEAQTPADLKARAEREQAAAAADKAEQRRLADKAKADAERDEFALTGSDRPADVAAAAGQTGLFDAPSATTEAQQAAPSKAEPGTAAKVENFGQALPPARRAMAAKLDEALSNDDIATRPLSEIWPIAANDAIEDTFAAAVAHAARAEVPAKPRVAYKLKRWVESVKTVRDLAGMIVSGRTSKEQLADMIAGPKATKHSLRDWWSKVRLLEQLPREQWKRIGAVEERPEAFTYSDGRQVPSPLLRVSIDDKSHLLDGDGTVNGSIDKIRGLLGAGAPEKRMQFEIRGYGPFKVNKKGDPEYRPLMTFPTVKEARAALTEQYDGLVAAWGAVKSRDNITERDLRSAENRPRAGKDWRDGKDVTPEQFQQNFGFRGGEWGAWVQQGKGDKERQAMLNGAYDALMDLAEIVGVPPRAMSLNGTLGIAFGSRGSGWASAHFEPSNLVISLTKTRGAGALAHEWFHALDNYFSRLRRGGQEAAFTGDQEQYRRENFITHQPEVLMVRKDGSRRFPPMTAGKLKAAHESRKHLSDDFSPERWQPDPTSPEPVRPEVEQRFVALVDALRGSPMAARAALLDKSGSGYWSRTLEVAARAFESFVIARMHEQGYHNDFLVNVLKAEEIGKDPARYPYLLAGEVKPIAEAFDTLFGEMKTREDDAGNVAMFSQSDIDFTDPKSAADVLMAWGAQAQYQYDKTEAKGLAEIAEAKGATAEPETVTQPDNTEKPTGRWEITLPGVKPTADLVVEGDEVFINVARLPVGSGGSRVYDIAAQFALNNGKVFIGDPSGVSPAAMRRRLENMLSSAIKYGTTDHLAPHPRQTIGDSSMDLPPLKWQTGDTRGNILAMLRVSNAVNDRKQASGSGVDYDAGAGAFRDSEGVPLERVDEALSDLSEFDRGTAGPGAAGRTTLQRAALFRALLRSDSARRSLLARLRGVSGDGGKATGRAAPEIDRILYSQSDDSIDLATLYDGIIVEQPILIEDTGQTGTLRLDAGKAIADIDERSRKMRRLLACLG